MVNSNNMKVGSYNIIHHSNTFGDKTVIGNFCEIGKNNKIGNSILQGRVRIADNCIIEDDVIIKYGAILTSKVTIKKGTLIGPNTITIGSTHERKTIHGTTIGRDCFIGAGTKIAAGVQICDGVTTGANSFVNRDITEAGLYVGTPVKKIR